MKTNATKTAKTPEENKELTSYQKLLITLDDDTQAYDFKVKTLDRAKALIGDILAVTTGNNIVTEHNSEWGHAHFLELFEMLSIRHKNFDVPDFIADLEECLFAWTMTHDEEKRNWEKALLARRGLDEHGIELETPIETDSPIDAHAPKQTLAEHHLQIMANKISHILRSDKVSDDAKDAFHSIIVDASNEARTNVGVSHPEVIKIAFPLLVESLECDYGRGVVHSLSSLLDSSLVYSVEDELRQYEKRFDGRASELDGSPSEPEVLDVSDSSIEDLAQKLSDIMHNPYLPKEIQECLEENLSFNYIDFHTPENILGNLKELNKTEAEND